MKQATKGVWHYFSADAGEEHRVLCGPQVEGVHPSSRAEEPIRVASHLFAVSEGQQEISHRILKHPGGRPWSREHIWDDSTIPSPVSVYPPQTILVRLTPSRRFLLKGNNSKQPSPPPPAVRSKLYFYLRLTADLGFFYGRAIIQRRIGAGPNHKFRQVALGKGYRAEELTACSVVLLCAAVTFWVAAHSFVWLTTAALIIQGRGWGSDSIQCRAKLCSCEPGLHLEGRGICCPGNGLRQRAVWYLGVLRGG